MIKNIRESGTYIGVPVKEKNMLKNKRGVKLNRILVIYTNIQNLIVESFIRQEFRHKTRIQAFNEARNAISSTPFKVWITSKQYENMFALCRDEISLLTYLFKIVDFDISEEKFYEDARYIL